MNRYRSRLQIIRDVLLIVDSKNGSKKTHILYGANFSHRLLTSYLAVIINAGLLQYDGESYRITEKGRMFRKLYETYEKNCKELEEHQKDLENEKEHLENMLMR